MQLKLRRTIEVLNLPRLFFKFCLFISIVFLGGCGSLAPNLQYSGTIRIEDLVMAKSVDSQNNPIDATTTFKATDPRIYAAVSIQGPDDVKLGARWYRGNKLLGPDQWIDLGAQRNGSWWLEPAPGEVLPTGDYRIEIFFVNAPNKIAHFKVIDER